MRRLLLLPWLLLGCSHPSGHQHGHSMPHRFENAEQWAQHFDDPARDAWQRPDEVLLALALPPDAAVADVGAGTGYFAVRLARKTPQGRVYAVDIEPSMVHYLEERARKEGLSNLTAVQGGPASPNLPEPVDLILMVDTYHHLEGRVGYFERLRAKLRPGGRLAVIDFKKESKLGPPPQHKLAPAELDAELAQAGWSLDAAPDLLPEQYLRVYRPRGEVR